MKHLYGHSGSITALSFTPDQQMLLSSSTDGTVRLWTTQWHKNLAAYKYVGWGVMGSRLRDHDAARASSRQDVAGQTLPSSQAASGCIHNLRAAVTSGHP